MSFLIQREHKSKNFPSFNRPEVVGYFSLSGQEREYSQDLAQLKYYNANDKTKKQVNFNLNDGINQVIRKPANLNEKIDQLLRWIISNYTKIRANPEQNRWFIYF